ncbi:MAG: hypothetical protein ACLGI6_11755 [Gammaproteobacteria bacterium]
MDSRLRGNDGFGASKGMRLAFCDTLLRQDDGIYFAVLTQLAAFMQRLI